MIPAAQFKQITAALKGFNDVPLDFKKIPEDKRAQLLVALETLKGFDKTPTDNDINNIVIVLGLFKDGNIPKTSIATKIQKAIRNVFGRVSSSDLAKASHQAERDLWLKQGEAFFKLGNTVADRKAYAALSKAVDLGSVRAKSVLGIMMLQNR